MLFPTFRFRMEDNNVKEEEERRKTTEDGVGGTGGEWFDLNELSALLCELDAVATQVRSQPAFHIQFLLLDHFTILFSSSDHGWSSSTRSST